MYQLRLVNQQVHYISIIKGDFAPLARFVCLSGTGSHVRVQEGGLSYCGYNNIILSYLHVNDSAKMDMLPTKGTMVLEYLEWRSPFERPPSEPSLFLL